MARPTLFWDFDGTLAARAGMWRRCLVDAARAVDPELSLSEAVVAEGLREGFPWQRPERPHAHLTTPEAWWDALFPTLEGALRRAGAPAECAHEAARAVPALYLDPAAWRVFDDTVPTLARLSADGWRHVILSNHVPELPGLVADLDLAGHFDRIHTSATIGWEKPHRLAFEHARAAAGHPLRCFMIGDDRVADIAGAEGAGIEAIPVRRGGEHPLRGLSVVIDRVAGLL